MKRFPQSRILLFAREPVAGQVKTRLIPALGEAGAADLHVQLLRRQIRVLRDSELCPAELWVDRNPEHPEFLSFPGACYCQTGADLGEKMSNAACQVLSRAGCEQVVLIGSDCPGLDAAYLEQALAALERGCEVVLGPAGDGGYVLIGLRQAQPYLFEGVNWGSDQVLEQTLTRVKNAALSCGLLPERVDIDRPEDLNALPEYDIYPTVSKVLLAGN